MVIALSLFVFTFDRWKHKSKLEVQSALARTIFEMNPYKYRPHSVDSTSLSGNAAYGTGRHDDRDDDDHYDVPKING